MNSQTIREIALLASILPQQWNRNNICKYYGISPAKLEKIKASPHWQEMDSISRKLLSEHDSWIDRKWKEDLLNEIENHHDHQLRMGRLQQSSCIAIHKMINRRLSLLDDKDGEEFAEAFDTACHPLSSMLKAVAGLDSQADKNISEGLAIAELIEYAQSRKKEEIPHQLSLDLHPHS